VAKRLLPCSVSANIPLYDSATWALSLQYVFKDRSVQPCQLSCVLCAGIDPDKHLDLQTLGWDKCTAAMEEAISSEKAEPIFQLAADKFQEVAATGGSLLNTSLT